MPERDERGTVSWSFGPFAVHASDGRGYFKVALSRKRELLLGRFVIGGWKARVSKHYDWRHKTTKPCDRGCGSLLEWRGWDDDSLSRWYFCPRCRYRMKPGWEIGRAAGVHRQELGMSEDEYDAHMRSFISTTPLSPAVLERARKRAIDEGWADIKP